MKPLNYNKKDLATLKNNYFMARTLYEIIKAEAEASQAKVLCEHIFMEDAHFIRKIEKRNPKRITQPKHTYKMSEADFQIFLDLCYEEYKKAGIEDKRGKEYCPEAEAHDLYWEAEKQLVLYGIDIIPDGMTEKETLREAVKNIKYKEKVLDLVLRLAC